MSKGFEESRVTRRKLLAGAGGVAGAIVADSLWGPALARAVPRRRLAPTTVTVMGNDEFTDAYIKDFENKNPNISINFMNFDAAKFQALMAAGTPPDLWRTQAPLVPQWAKRGELLNLDKYFAASDLIHPAALLPASNYYRFDGKSIGKGPRYGMVKDWSPDETVFVNLDFLKGIRGVEIPGPTDTWTYDDLWTLASKVKKAKRPHWTLDVANAYTWIDRQIMAMLAAKGKALYPADFSHINLTNNPEAVKVISYLFRYSKNKMDLGPENPNPDGWSGPGFVASKGTVAMTQYGYWFGGDMIGNAAATKRSRMLPAPIWNHGKKVDPTITATGFVISARTKNPDAAWAVFEYYMGGFPARDRAGQGWGVPAQKSLFDRLPRTNAFQKNNIKVLLHELPTADVILQFNPNLVGLGDSTAVASAYMKYLPDAVKGKLSFQSFLKNIENDSNRAIAQGKNG
jgi:ABC-type glycerol-3-phosphate transport system substrate-binding protein